MGTEYSAENVIEFLNHTADRGLMPAASAQALAVACRNVFSVLDEQERGDIRHADVGKVIKRFNNKRARDFNPKSLKEYGRRVQKAVTLFLDWKKNPAEFSVVTRNTARTRTPTRPKQPSASPEAISRRAPPNEPRSTESPTSRSEVEPYSTTTHSNIGFQTAFPVRSGVVITISNVPEDLTETEAERLSQFVRLLGTVN